MRNPTRPATLPKLTRPKLHDAVRRVRLSSAFDATRARFKAVCVVGPPGSGKTTSVASWIDEGGLPGIWYQMDAGDEDLATFFLYLGEAVRHVNGCRSVRLPRFATEYHDDVTGFARRFFRSLFAALPNDAVLVLDNYQEVGPCHLLHSLVADAVDEIADGQLLIVISRRDPPDCYARLVANRHVRTVDWEFLKLDLQETQEIVTMRIPGTNRETVAHLHEQCAGWAAGLTLLLESGAGESAQCVDSFVDRDKVFSYFATQFFDRLPDEAKALLATTAVLPQVPLALAVELTGTRNASRILDDLYRRHLFTHRREGAHRVYWFHALFRSFLLERAPSLLGNKRFREKRLEAARLLARSGEVIDAFRLYGAAGDWQSACRLIEDHAETLLSTGRALTLRDSIAALPAEVLDRAPWSLYWQGVSLIHADQAKARVYLERAHAMFHTLESVIGKILTAAAVIESCYFEWTDYTRMDRWLGEMESLIAPGPHFPSGESELRAYSSLFIAVVYRRTRHPLTHDLQERVLALLCLDLDKNQRVTAGTILLLYFTVRGDFAAARQVEALVEPCIGDPNVTPSARFFWWTRLAYLHNSTASYHEALRALDAAERIADAENLRTGRVLAHLHRVLSAIGANDLETARTYVARIDSSLDPSKGVDCVLAANAHALVALQEGNMVAGLSHCERGLEQAAKTGVPYIEALLSVLYIYALLRTQAHDAASRTLKWAYDLCRDSFVERYELELRLVEAYSALCQNQRERCHALLRRALPDLESSYLYNLRFVRDLLPAVFEEALSKGIEVDKVRQAILKYDIRPASPSAVNWPWSVEVRVLGAYRVVLNRRGSTGSEPLLSSKRSNYKQHELLKLLAVAGTRGLSSSFIQEKLWPDAEGDLGLQALYTTVHRLRKLLGNEESVMHRDGVVSLNKIHCWTDIDALNALAIQIDALTTVSPIEQEPLVRALFERLMRTYLGGVLEHEVDTAWAISARAGAQRRFRRAVIQLGQHWESRSQWGDVLAVYAAALERDMLCETFYQRLIDCHLRQGQRAQAIETYMACRRILVHELGVPPSIETNKLIEAIQ